MRGVRRFSIIIPAHNSSTYIINALESVKKQTFKSYELIVICDSCTDNTEKIAKSYGAKTYVVDFHNDGLSRSKGLDVAKGEYVLFMDDDDWWLHEFVLEQIDKKLKSYDKIVDILCFSFIFKGVCYASPLLNHNDYWHAVWNKCWRRAVIGDTRFPNIYSKSDSYFHTDMFKKNLCVKIWDMPMYYYNYLRDGSISKREGQKARNIKKWLNT